jgi:hypothetical protein
MSEAYNLIPVGDDYRISVFVDSDAICPRLDYEMVTGFIKIPRLGDSRLADVPAVWPDEFGIESAHERIALYSSPRLRYSGSEETVVLWARDVHDVAIQFDHAHGGYWFVSLKPFAEGWPDLVAGTPERLAKQTEVIDAERQIYEQWADNEVYGVVFQRRVDLYELDDRGIATDREATVVWDDVEALWGCYLDDTYTPMDVAKEIVGSEYIDKLEAGK